MVGPRTQQWRGPYIHQADVHPVPLGRPELLANLTMRMLWCSAALRLAFLLPTIGTSAPSPPTELFSPLVAEKVLRTALSPPTPAQYPQYTDRAAGDWLYFAPDTWTSGFFPATLYALHARAQLCRWPAANAAQWLALGRRWSAAEVPLAADNTVGHDVGFLSYPFVAELAVNPHNATAITAVNRFASDLAARFNPVVGCTRSWDTPNPVDFEVIIDNMMNLEVFTDVFDALFNARPAPSGVVRFCVLDRKQDPAKHCNLACQQDNAEPRPA